MSYLGSDIFLTFYEQNSCDETIAGNNFPTRVKNTVCGQSNVDSPLALPDRASKADGQSFPRPRLSGLGLSRVVWGSYGV